VAVLRDADVSSFLKSRLGGVNGLLLFGNDDSAIDLTSRRVKSAFMQGEEPLHLSLSELRNDAALLDDAFRAMSLLGDRRLIVLEGVDDSHLAFLSPVIASASIGNFVLLLAGSLKKDSKLRSAVEASHLFAMLPLYEDASEGAAILRVQTLAKEAGIAFGADAVERLVELCGTDRSVLANEVEKLALYCWPAKSVELADVEEASGDKAGFDWDLLTQYVFDGDMNATDRMFASVVAAGEGRTTLIMLQLYLGRMEAISASVAGGLPLANALRAARPPIFGRQLSAMERHMKTLGGEGLQRAQSTVQSAVLASRQNSDLSDAITGRCLLSLARMARAG
jgi:DNA polymerase III subunit delta